jgi:hypothetical protein
MRLIRLFEFLLVLLMLGFISSGFVVHDVQAQVVNYYPFNKGDGPFEPLAGAGLWSYVSGFNDDIWNSISGGVLHRVEAAAAYLGEGTKPMADVAAFMSISDYYGYTTSYGARAEVDMGWPYRIFDRNTGNFLNRPGSLSIPMRVKYRVYVDTDLDATASASYAVAHGYFEVRDYVSSEDLTASNGKNLGTAGTLTFTLTGPPWPVLNMVIDIDVGVNLPTETKAYSASAEAEAIVDPYLYIDPAFPLADELEVRTLKSIDAPEDDPSSWVPAVDTPVSFFPTTTVDTNPRTVNEIGSETTKISGNLTSNGTGLEGKTMKLYYQDAPAEYETPRGNWTHIANVSTNSGGYYEYDWNPEDALATGNYCIKADFEGDVDYLPRSATTGIDAIPNPVVVPEIHMGTIAVLATMTLTFAEMIVFRKKRTIKLHVS